VRRLKDYILLFLKGVAMGGADVVPGVSGGTIAFISGIYEELLTSIKAVNYPNLKLLFGGQFKAFWRAINGSFLLAVFGGILVSVKSLATLILFFKANYPIQLWSFFWGLIMISSIVVLRQISKWNVAVIITGVIGIIIAFGITTLTPAHTSDSLLMILTSGALAISAMILPGISGAFILLILGKYEFIISAVSELNLYILGIFAVGCLLGLVSFVRIISWLLEKYHNVAVALLAGFMMGSLNKLWPWKQVVEYRLDRHGEQVPMVETNILPNNYYEVTGQDPVFIQALLYMALGFFIIVIIEKIALRISTSKK
jgi:putative membrane protein